MQVSILLSVRYKKTIFNILKRIIQQGMLRGEVKIENSILQVGQFCDFCYF